MSMTIEEMTERPESFWSKLLSTEKGRARAIELLDKAPKIFSEWKAGKTGVFYRNGPLLRDALVWRVDGKWVTSNDEKTFTTSDAARAHIDEKLLAEGHVLRGE